MIPLRDDNPTTLRPLVTISLIAACTLVFLWQLSLGAAAERIVQMMGAIPAHLTGHRAVSATALPVPLTIITSMFLHGGLMHLAGNMLYLWIFGNNVEDAMGHFRFAMFYLLCGMGAVVTQTLTSPISMIPMIGASGAISGVLGAYLLLYPHARVLVLIPLGILTRIVKLPAMVVLGFWFAIQILSAVVSDPDQPGVAFAAHAGGFLSGLLLILLFKRRGTRLFQPRQPQDRE